jgi:hypothetical protein
MDSPVRIYLSCVYICLSLLFLVGCSGGPSSNPDQIGIATDLSKVSSVVPSLIASFTANVSFSTPTITSTKIPVPTNTPVPSQTPSLTVTNLATATSSPTETSTSTAVPMNLDNSSLQMGGTVENSVRIFFIRKNTGGPICGDSLVWINTDIPSSGNTVKNITAALTRLFSYRTKYVGDNYNPAYVVSAKVKKVTLSKDGFLFIQLAGSMKERTKDDCENIRLRSQIWSTFRQFKGYDGYDIYLDSTRLGDLINTDR